MGERMSFFKVTEYEDRKSKVSQSPSVISQHVPRRPDHSWRRFLPRYTLA